MAHVQNDQTIAPVEVWRVHPGNLRLANWGSRRRNVRDVANSAIHTRVREHRDVITVDNDPFACNREVRMRRLREFLCSGDGGALLLE